MDIQKHIIDSLQEYGDYSIIKITKLSPILKNPSIIARVISKQEVIRMKAEQIIEKTQQQDAKIANSNLWNNSISVGSYELLDESLEVIQLFLFGDEQIEDFSKLLEENHVYHFFNFGIKAYSSSLFPNQHFKLVVTKTFFLREINSDNEAGAEISKAIPTIFLKHQTYQEIEKAYNLKQQSQTVDTAGVIIYSCYSDLKEKGQKLVIVLEDEQKSQITLNLTSNLASKFKNIPKYSILLLRNLKAFSHQSQVQLASIGCSQIFIDPSPEQSNLCPSLQSHRDQLKKEEQSQDANSQGSKVINLTSEKTLYQKQQAAIQKSLQQNPANSIDEIERKAKQTLISGQLLSLSSSVKAGFFSISSRVHYYFACKYCQKRVSGKDSQCQTCQVEASPTIPKLLVNMILADNTSQIHVTCFSEEAEIILSKSSVEILDIVQEIEQEVSDPTLILKSTKDAFAHRAGNQFLFKIVSKLEQFNGVKKVSHKVQRAYKENKNIHQQDTGVDDNYQKDSYSSQDD